MNSIIRIPLRYSIVLLISVLFVSGCSSSSDSGLDSSQENTTNGSSDEPVNGNDGFTTESTDTDTATVSEDSSTTRVDFDITVPAFMSDALQVRLVWGDVDTTAIWNRDELWTASIDFPANTANQLVVTFGDGNGAVILGSFETLFRTSTNATESFQIAADEFDTDRWDNDGDGVSNLSESIAGTNPEGRDVLEPVQASLEHVQDKTFRISWQPSEGAQFYRVFENPDGVSGFTGISEDLNGTTTDFDHRVALYARVNAQYLVQSCNDQGCVDSEPVIVTGTLASAIGYFKASNTDENDQFGRSVSLSVDGNTLAVGADGEDSGTAGINGDEDDNSADRSGAVYIFVRNGAIWQQQAYIKASNTDGGDEFGRSVSLSADGNTLAVGARGEASGATGMNGDEDDNSADGSGAVFVFVRNAETWQQQAYVKASNSDESDRFGGSVSLSADGNTLAVGATSEDSAATGINGDQNEVGFGMTSGAVYVFVRNGETWQQQAYVKASNTGESDLFGFSVSLSADGNTLAVGAVSEESRATGINGEQRNNSTTLAGAVYVFVRNAETWQQQAYVKASNTGEFDFFGFSVSLSADGNTLAVGAYMEKSAATGINGNQSDNSAGNSGAVYVFARSGETWQQEAYIKASNAEASDLFGADVSLSADGNTLAVGAEEEESAATGVDGDQSDNSAVGLGAVYVFMRSGETWQQQAYVKASNSPDGFGRSVSLSADGNTLAVGSPGEDSAATGINGVQADNSRSRSGAVYLY